MKRRVSSGFELTLFRHHLRQALALLASPTASSTSPYPLVDVSASDSEIVVRVDLPGTDPASLKVQVLGQELRVSGEKPAPAPGRRYFQVERSHGPFLLEVALPGRVLGSKGRASLRAGVLEVRLPREPELPPQATDIPVDIGEP
ncbi:MAG: Hsp20/alpha crystallin family protein [Thermoanaerobaculum sp.]